MNNSSQPYLYLNTKNEKCLFYCFGREIRTLVYGNEYQIRPWKIRHKNYITNEDLEVPTATNLEGYGDVILECNPHIYTDKLYCTLGFNKGFNYPINYYLCSYDILDMNIMSVGNLSILEKTFTGTVVDNMMIYANPNKNGNLIVKNYLTNVSEERILPTTYIYKINKIFNQDYYILTGQEEDEAVSYLLDLNLEIVKKLTNQNNENIYKCSILNNELIYTVKIDSGPNESRSLVTETLVS